MSSELPLTELRFCVAGLEVSLCSPRPDGLAALGGFYAMYPSRGGTPALTLEIERAPGLGAGKAPGPEYPGFAKRALGAGRIGLARCDADGEILLPEATSEPVRGRFRVADNANTLEAAIRIGVSIAMTRRGGFIMHASAVRAPMSEEGDGCAVFAGVSGAGKSTIAAMLADTFAAVEKVSDELVIVAPSEGGWAAFVTPFIGSAGLPHGTSHRVTGVFFLVQALEHQRTRMGHGEALREILRHVLVYVVEPDTAERVLAAAGQLTAQVPCYQLAFAKDPSVAAVVGITC